MAIEDDTPRDEALDEGLEAPDLSKLNPDLDNPDITRVGELEEADGEEDTGPEVTELTPEERQQFDSLLTIGKRIKKVIVLDRPVVIASLMVDDIIRVGEKVKPYRDSEVAFPKAYQAAVCAASIKSVDGQSWENTFEANPDPDVLFEQKWERVIRFYPLVVQNIYQEIITLDAEFAELAEKLGKLKG